MKQIKKYILAILLLCMLQGSIVCAEEENIDPYYHNNKYDNWNYNIEMDQEQDAHFYEELAAHPDIDLMTCREAPTATTYYYTDKNGENKVKVREIPYGENIDLTFSTPIVPDYTMVNPYIGEILDGHAAGTTLLTPQTVVTRYGNGIIYEIFDSYNCDMYEVNVKGEYEILKGTPFGDISRNSVEALILSYPESYSYYMQGNDPHVNAKAMYCYEQWVWYKNRIRYGYDLWPIVELQAESYAKLYAMNFIEYYLGLKK